MRSVSLAAAFAAGALLAGCSKPEPAAGAPSPTAVSIDSIKTVDSASTMTDSAAAAMKDSATAAVDTTKKN